MSETAGLHLWRFCALFVLGTTLEVIFEIYTAFRAAFPLPKTIRTTADVLIASLSLSGLAFSLFFINGGELRLYVVVGLGLGFSITRYAVGKLLSRAFRGMFVPMARSITWVHQRTRSFLRSASNSIRALVKKLTSRLVPPA